jgi:hypothetical protein
MRTLLHTPVVVIMAAIIVGCGSSTNGPDTKSDAIERDPSPSGFSGGILYQLPFYDRESGQQCQVDLRSKNVSSLDLTERLNDLLYADFDSRTVWPEKSMLPPLFDPEQILETGKNPGLGVRTLHDRGIEGQTVGIGIIDQPLLVHHHEIADNLEYYREIGIENYWDASMHGCATSSIAVGKTVGVAPKAHLYYIASTTGTFVNQEFTFDFSNYAKAVRQLLQLNDSLPQDRKIRVIAMQVGWNSSQAGYDEIMAACDSAASRGIMVISSSSERMYSYKFNGLNRNPLLDPDDFNAYGLSSWTEDKFGGLFEGRLLIPMDSRTTASPSGNGDYVFYREGGWSWVVPYIAGMYALAVQVKPSITPDEFWETAMATGRTIILHTGKSDKKLGPILDPVRCIDAIKR